MGVSILRVSLSCISSWAPRRVGSRRDEKNSNHMDDDSNLITFTESGGEGNSVAQPTVDDPRAGQSEGDLLADTLLADLAIGSVQFTISEAKEEQADTLLGHSDVEMALATPEVVVAPQLQQPKPKRPSGLRCGGEKGSGRRQLRKLFQFLSQLHPVRLVCQHSLLQLVPDRRRMP